MKRKSIVYSAAADIELVRYNENALIWAVEYNGEVLFSSVDKYSAIETFCAMIDVYLGLSDCIISDEDFEEFIEEDFEK